MAFTVLYAVLYTTFSGLRRFSSSIAFFILFITVMVPGPISSFRWSFLPGVVSGRGWRFVGRRRSERVQGVGLGRVGSRKYVRLITV